MFDINIMGCFVKSCGGIFKTVLGAMDYAPAGGYT